MKERELIRLLKDEANADNLTGMARYGINTENTLGVSMPFIRQLAKRLGTDHELALKLWDTQIHEARILASLVADRQQVNKSLMNRWAADFNSWDICDQVCSNLFRYTPYAREKAMQWSRQKKEFVKRAGFVLMAGLCVADKRAADESFYPFLERIEEQAGDERNFVKKAINWALRQIGKRNRALNRRAITVARRIAGQSSPAARWIAADALRELMDEKQQARLKVGAQA